MYNIEQINNDFNNNSKQLKIFIIMKSLEPSLIIISNNFCI